MPDTEALEFLTFRPQLAPHFKAINEEWIAEMFVLEKSDLEVLEQPQERVIDQGGQIWFAKHPSLGVIGCCAILPRGEGAFELTKMGVLKSARGLKVGEQLLRHVLVAAEQMPIRRLYLLTDQHCEAAIHIYLKNGFLHDECLLQSLGNAYARCDVAMRYPSIWHD